MRLVAIKFAGYPAGQTDFNAIESAAPLADRAALQNVLNRIAAGIISPASGQFTSLIIVGHSDRQDLATMSCDERRKSEADAARSRAVSAWEWTKTQVNGRLAVAGRTLTAWWDEDPSLTWGLVYAGAGMLERELPANEEDRKLNRRVLFLVSEFPHT
jgi:hypothetical protein